MTPTSSAARGARALSISATAWYFAAAAGQLAFAGFILAFSGPRLLRADYLALNDKPHITGWVPGDSLGNVQLVLHLLLGAVLTVAGLLQLLPALRRRWPALHRWNGRVFLSAALLTTLSGFYLTWIRGSQLGAANTLSITLNGALILIFIALAWRSARQRDFTAHRRHALRAFMVISGVWFLRIGIMLSAVVLAPFGVPLGYDGAVFVTLTFLSWMLPLAVVELYLAAEASPRPALKFTVAATLVALALATAVGSAAAIALMWWPRL